VGDPEPFGRYLVYEQLGMGGMASVHRAEVTGVDGFRKAVALKRMLPSLAANADMVKSFVREARLASYLHHANVAQTHELGKVDDVYFIAMELVTGRNLREIFKHCAQTTGTVPVPVALNILNQICDALDYAHNLADEHGAPLGIIHRDVTPSNIILSEQGVVKLIDFGIAKASAAGMQTMSGTIKGKFGYMAPEYLAGRIDARADLFAIGVIAHELLTNRPLFTAGDDMETLQRVQHMEIQPPSRRNPAVPPEIDHLVMTALERDPEHRWQQATALRAALTTTTKRLGLEASNSEVVRWIDWVYEQTKKNVFALPASALDAPTTEMSVGGGAASDTLTSNDMNPLIEMMVEVPVTGPTAVLAPASERANYPRHQELPPGFSSSSLIPTTVRPSQPKILASSSNDAITSVRPATPLPAPKPNHTGRNALLALLVVAAAAVAVVYFAIQ
jgi:serine/threonine protein kinase